MKLPYKNIYDVLKLNRYVTIIVTVTALLSSVFSGVMVFNMYQKAMDSAFAVNTDGSVIPLKLVSQKENLQVEALSHLQLFHEYFYGIDDSNYESNLEKALWLGNSTVDNVYRQKKADGVYNRILQYSLVQKVLNVESQVDLRAEPYRFKTITVFEINRGSVIDRYEMVSTGELITVDRNYPKNTHGLLITDYFESSLKKVKDED
ncbi:conjugal transfer protein TraK [Maribacter arenosus]|uniref:Conjugal transfer protein TraK n=1 Tax=Maribacter arenosus TaxID=1854708 RepID=A0ABR7VE07_9FLAO|nr:conjugal transfer protein TraK [Maribacter arenosus]MBD0851873.1 conjugal transfer protein TraK [Maribacter arenosus]